jgi:hypothetical protein
MIATLDQLAIYFGTDKSSRHHNYCEKYERYFEPIRTKNITLFEFGYGGYAYPDRGGEGARTWRAYFPNATIVSTDLYAKTNVTESINFEQGSQNDPNFCVYLSRKYEYPDVVILDASHINPLDIRTFEIMFPLLKPGGIFVWEDLESSWWEDIASDGTNFQGKKDPDDFNSPTAINFLRGLLNDVNAKHCPQEFPLPIESIHFYENIAFIIKK